MRFPVADLQHKLSDLDVLKTNLTQQLEERASHLNDAMNLAMVFSKVYSELMKSLRDIQDNLMSQDSPGVDTGTVQEQQKELDVREPPKTMKCSVERLRMLCREVLGNHFLAC